MTTDYVILGESQHNVIIETLECIPPIQVA